MKKQINPLVIAGIAVVVALIAVSFVLARGNGSPDNVAPGKQIDPAANRQAGMNRARAAAEQEARVRSGQ